MSAGKTARSTRSAPWLKSPTWDLGGLAYCWLPFYVFVVFGLGLDGGWSTAGSHGAGREPGLGLAMLVALAITYVHRHYTFILVYGDRETFERRRKAYLWAPAILFVGLALILRGQGEASAEIAGVTFSPWLVVLTITGVWNVWHTIMQRHGIFRIYAGKAGKGLQAREHGRRDFRLVWSLVALVAVIVPMFRQETFAGVFNARRLLGALEPLLGGTVGTIVLVVVVALVLLQLRSWLVAELGADLEFSERLPRWGFLSSTLALLAVFIVHGPIVGYLCFGTAHAIEYVFFLHHFGRRKFAQNSSDGSLVARMLRRPVRWAPILVGSLLAVFWILKDQRSSEAWLVYYTATSLLHFLYDGWIWKVRKPEVAKPLGLTPA